MKKLTILFTGASSFTGYWFVKTLHEAGHQIVATFQAPGPEVYAKEPLREQRVQKVLACCEPVWGCKFGDDKFLAAIRARSSWDVLCHHAADVTNYKSPDFNVSAAVASNTHQLRNVLGALKDNGCHKVVLTGSVFEGHEGSGSQGLPHFSPYGLSKSLTAEIFRYYTQQAGVTLGKFVIPNPFGPWEEPRFTAYLIKTWKQGQVASVKTPAYVRDNIHASLLAKAYRHCVENLVELNQGGRYGPSGYAESQGAFTLRFAEQMRLRLKLACEVKLETQTDFAEPRVRVNTDIPDVEALGWNEAQAWDELADYYR